MSSSFFKKWWWFLGEATTEPVISLFSKFTNHQLSNGLSPDHDAPLFLY